MFILGHDKKWVPQSHYRPAVQRVAEATTADQKASCQANIHIDIEDTACHTGC
jgi:hypothetical protein